MERVGHFGGALRLEPGAGRLTVVLVDVSTLGLGLLLSTGLGEGLCLLGLTRGLGGLSRLGLVRARGTALLLADGLDGGESGDGVFVLALAEDDVALGSGADDRDQSEGERRLRNMTMTHDLKTSGFEMAKRTCRERRE